MTRNLLLASALFILTMAPVQAFAGVTVHFVDPAHYTDAGSFGAGSQESTLAEVRRYLPKLGARLLPARQNLTIDVLNIDLAGEYEPWRPNLSDVRIMRDITPPSLKLRYVLTERGHVLQRGEETVTDMTYQMNPSARFSSDRYAYEKSILDDWFRRTFLKSRSSGGKPS